MKKKSAAILTFLFSLCFSFSFRSPEVVSANSASRVTLGTDSNGVVSKSENCPLEVKGEKLNFYVSSFPVLPDQPSGGAYLSAEYNFYNPTDLDIDAELVFPFGAAPEYSDGLDDLSDFDVLVNGEVVEKELRHTYSSSYAFDLDRDMSKIRDEMIEDAFFRKNAAFSTIGSKRFSIRERKVFPSARLFDFKGIDRSGSLFDQRQYGLLSGGKKQDL